MTLGERATRGGGAREVVEDDRPRQAYRVAARPGGVVVDTEMPFRHRGRDTTGPSRLFRHEAEGVRAGVERRADVSRHVTSAKSNGGTWIWVMVGSRPTTSSAISRASSSVDGGLEAHPAHRRPVAADD